MSEESEKLPTIAELFAKIGPHRTESEAPPLIDPTKYYKLRGRRKAYKFALLYVKNNFEARPAFREMLADMGRAWTPNSKATAMLYANSAWVAQCVREIVQKMATQVITEGANELEQMLTLNRFLIHGDIVDLVEQESVYVPGPLDKEGNQTDGVWKTITRLKNLSRLSKQERMMIKEIRFHRTGEVAAIKAYDRLDAQRAQVALLEILQARGGSDTDWMADFRTRIGDAKKKAIEFEVARGKVIMLNKQTA